MDKSVTEDTIQYIVYFLSRYQDEYPTKRHADALKEIRELSDMLLETLERPARLVIYRHKLK